MEEMVLTALESFTLLGPDGHQVHRPDLIQFISPAIPHGAMNTVVRSRFSSGELDEKIESALKPYIESNLNCWWILGPNSTNRKETEMRLSERGFELEHEAFGLMLPTTHQFSTKISPKVSVEKITETTIDNYLRAARDGQEPSASYRNYFTWLMKKHGDQLEVFLSRVDGEPAGTGLLQHFDGAANFVSGFVRPKFRGIGAYQALVKYRLEKLRERKVPFAIVLSKAKTSAPLLMKNGFSKVCEFRTLERITKK